MGNAAKFKFQVSKSHGYIQVELNLSMAYDTLWHSSLRGIHLVFTLACTTSTYKCQGGRHDSRDMNPWKARFTEWVVHMTGKITGIHQQTGNYLADLGM